MIFSTAIKPLGQDMIPVPAANTPQRARRSGLGVLNHFAGSAPLTMLALCCALSACSSLPQSGISFATRGEQIGDQRSQTAVVQTKTQAQFAKGQVTLVAPQGHCIDATMLRQEATGGFALLPRCNLLHGTQLFGRNRAAVITATIGPAQGAAAPSTTELAQTAEGARLLYYDDKGLLPLVRLQWPGHSAMGGSGASDEHWRGAFVVNNHLVVLALYAPEGSNLLGAAGAKLLTDMTRRSQKASLQAAPQPAAISAREDNVRRPAQQAASPTTRPKARPGSQAGASDPALSPAVTQKLSLRRRIGGLFRTSPEARLTTE
ncbi:hypothetical protein [Pseudophaeobacter sp. EL27]|uniref:hypothetical protein n=1 Tax=Pseudophaeobacter sp. EL27 TaxID=2107580 RepID=UPI000EFBAF4B|nr:hypothetical protein [Pseudophaeobacter sp. EL27]